MQNATKDIVKQDSKPTLLLHACCGPCSTHVIQAVSSSFRPTIFFFNPNIHPSDEYEKRLDALCRAAEKNSIPIIEGPYNIDDWSDLVGGFEKEGEGGKRCYACYGMRLRECAMFASYNDFEYFGTTLSVSPHKDSQRINDIGAAVARAYGIKYLSEDFKKDNGYRISVELSKELSLYRQKYCGCIYSMRNKAARPIP